METEVLNLEQFKEEIIKGYVDRYLDRLLDLRNIIAKAKSFDEISEVLKKEQETLVREFDINRARVESVRRNGREDKKTNMS